MGRFVSAASLVYILASFFALAGCGSSSPTRVIPNQIPDSVSLCPSPSTSCASGLNQSLEVGQTLGLTPSARNVLNQQIIETFSFQSSNPAIATVANSGAVCAGTWNSITAPTVCTPGPTGIVQITAVAQGVASPPVTIYVHQHITSIVVNPAPTQPALLGAVPPAGCLSKGGAAGPESFLLEAIAKNGSGADITPTVGPFSWQTVSPSGSTNIVSLTAPAITTGSPLNQQIVTASTPGLGQVFASANGLNSQPFAVETCRVQSISISAAGNPATNTFFVVNTGTSTTLNATVLDSESSLGSRPLTGVPLTWSTSNPASVGASGATSTVFGSVGTASAPAAGAGAVIASCTPPTCNGGIKITTSTGTSSLPIYPDSAISFLVRATSNTASPTAYATTTACTSGNPTNSACTPTIVPITRSSSSSAFAAGSPLGLPTTPNSFLFDNSGSTAYLGVDSSNFGQRGVMFLSGSSVSQFTGAPGKVLAISPESTNKTVIVSDTVDTPNQVFICTNCTTAGRTVTTFLIDKAIAAAFSPDGLKAYIVTSANCPGTSSTGCLLVYSRVDAPRMISLGAKLDDVSFFPEGAAAYLASGTASSVFARHTCDNSIADTISTAAAPALVRALPDNSTVMVLDPPFVQLVNVASNWSGCVPAISDSIVGTFDLGQGSFTPTQLVISADGNSAYILGKTSGANPAPFPFVMVFNIQTRTSSLLSLANSAVPLSAGLSPAGDLLFVGANDGAVHVIDTGTGLDGQPATFPFPTNELCFGPGNPPTRVPLSQVTISAASQSGSNTTYTYTLISGPSLQVNQTIVIANMGDGGNDGTFNITALGTDSSGNPTFTVANSLGVSATAQSGAGTVPITCNPDLVTVKP